ncbi:MAG TPA: DivIVA domain-containing protein [Acidimicrobiales bacterium]|nr:DivIVA domain-containing protein [Acidimicrobiales bacterium]
MADLESPADGTPPLDPDEVSERSFPTAFRGFDPVQVRSFLQTLADELRRLQAIESGLVDGAGLAGVAGPAVEDEAPATGTEGGAAAAGVDEARLEAERLVKDARDRVATLGSAATAEATRVLAEARAEAARLRATATDDLKGRVEEAEASAVRKIAEAEREAAAIRVKAREEADATIEAARVRGREMVAEAQAARERMLADLAKRKRAAQSQLEQLRAGRDRLLDTLKVARRSIDEMTTRFDANEGGSASTLMPPSSGMPSGQVTTTPGISSTEARPRPAATISTSPMSDPQPPRSVRTRAVAIGEAPPVAPRASIAAPQAGPPGPTEQEASAAPARDVPPVAVDSRPNPPSPPAPPAAAAASPEPPVPDRRSSALRILRRNKGNDGPPQAPPLIGRDSPGEGVRIIGRTPEEVPVGAVVVQPAPEPALDATTASEPTTDENAAVDDVASREDDVDLEALLASATEPEPEPRQEPEAEREPERVEHAEPAAPLAREEIRPRIEDLFARIRADREAATTSARQVLAAEAEGREATKPAPRAAPVLVAEERTTDADEARLQARDAVIEPLAGQLTKRLKRALQDEQNASLDRLRTSRGRLTVEDVLPSVDEQRTPYRTLAVPFLEQAARGAAATSRFGAVAVAVDDLAGQLAEDLADALRSRLDTVLAAGVREELDLSGIGERISSVYRDWKVQKLERLAMHYLVAAHERSGFLGHPEGTPLRWLVDDEGPCPDCEDNALAGATPRGERFPTGQLHPPAHLGCRCLLTPAPH